ncbi:MAG: BrnT family toxin [Chloroflexota bacterium]
MKFQWDPNKAVANLRKHGIRFEEALTVFQDPLAFIFDDEEHSRDEHREIIIGFSAFSRLLLVCFVERHEDIIRIISARRATPKEKQDYEEYIRSQKN